MEGLIPFLYRTIAQYKTGGQGVLSPSASYMRLPGESGRFSASEVQIVRPDCGFSACSPPPSAGKRDASSVNQPSGLHHLMNSCRAVK
ncbi:uncharacterized protein LOC105161592 [Sesamum indicum]|uniref:Uncharacterized protein LOC105161592 n=1 Tax=Sesamum indicum TaxID=4182 RepID=A0A6I9T641_SESIN|nr:uncharacterized protein LOC105161592 [Sesamum indicum]